MVRVRHFAFLDADERERLFLNPPEPVPADDIALRGVALGATLYSPATRPALAQDIHRLAGRGVTSLVACLEDAVADDELGAAEHNIVAQLRGYHQEFGSQDRPQLFIRIRHPDQIALILDGLGTAVDVLDGFVLPKFTAENGPDYFAALSAFSPAPGRRMLAMPVLEAPSLAHAETRVDALLAARSLLDEHRDQVLAVRIGATDLSATFGLRRSRELLAYDVQVLAQAIGDIVNVFGRRPNAYPISGPVWEHITGDVRMFKPQLREAPFAEHDERHLRAQLIAADLDKLLSEVALDKANGLTGKTVIHPTHVQPVHALLVVSHEEYLDATSILEIGATGGVKASAYGNKMNEAKPHTEWAERTLLRARAFGVSQPEITFVDLLAASLEQG